MSWLQKLLPPRIKSTPGVRKTPVPEGLVGQVRVVRIDALSHRPREEPARLPEMQLSTIASRRASASSSCWTPRAASRSASRSCRSTASSSRTRSAIRSGSRSRSRKPARPTRSSSCRAASQRAAGARHVRVQFHGRVDGLGRRRAVRPRRARRLREPTAVRVRLGIRRRANAGRRQFAVPDGEDDRGAAGTDEGASCRSCRS